MQMVSNGTRFNRKHINAKEDSPLHKHQIPLSPKEIGGHVNYHIMLRGIDLRMWWGNYFAVVCVGVCYFQSLSTFTSQPGGEGRNSRSWRPRPALVCAIPQNTVAIHFTSGDYTTLLQSGEGCHNVWRYTYIFTNVLFTIQGIDSNVVLVFSETE
jgi:hypothetical protein